MSDWWETVADDSLAQGDLIPKCVVPIMPGDLNPPENPEEVASYRFGAQLFDLVVVTQTCDIVDGAVSLPACCPYFSQAEFEDVNPAFKKGGTWGNVRKGRIEGIHLLASPADPTNPKEALVVEFRQVFSLPVEYLRARAGSLNERYRLKSPYLEHFSQAFGTYFMRVALPSEIPPFPKADTA